MELWWRVMGNVHIRKREVVDHMMLAFVQIDFCMCSWFLVDLGLVCGTMDLNIIMENASPLLVNSTVFIKLGNFLINKNKVCIIS